MPGWPSRSKISLSSFADAKTTSIESGICAPAGMLRCHASGALAAELRLRSPPQTNNKVHHAALDLVADLAVLIVLHEDGVIDIPIDDPAVRRRRQERAAHVDDE